MTAGSAGAARSGGRLVHVMGLLAGLFCLAGSTGCATVTQHDRDTLVRTRTERKPLSDWTFAGLGALVKGQAGEAQAVSVSATRDRACSITEIRTVDRTVETERTLQNQRQGRILAYTVGSLGAVNAVTGTVIAAQMERESDREPFIAQAAVGAFLSISLITMIVREFGAIDTETHVGLVDLPESRRGRCDKQPAAGARVRLLRTRSEVASEAAAAPDGTVTLPLDPASLTGDAVYALEVDGVIVSHIEIPAAQAGRGPAPAVAAPP